MQAGESPWRARAMETSGEARNAPGPAWGPITFMF